MNLDRFRDDLRDDSENQLVTIGVYLVTVLQEINIELHDIHGELNFISNQTINLIQR